MANDTIEVSPPSLRFAGFHPIREDGAEVQYYGLTDTVVFLKHDVGITAAAGGASLGTAGGVNAANFIGVAASGGGSATASANASTKVAFYLPSHTQQFWAKVGTGTAAATDVGEIVDLKDENEVDVTNQNPETTDMDGSTIMLVGFKILAVDTTNNYVKGVFVGF